MIRPETWTIRRTPYSAPTAPALWCPGTGCRIICTFPFPGWERRRRITFRKICPRPAWQETACRAFPEEKIRRTARTARKGRTAAPARSFPGKTTEKRKKPGWGRRRLTRSWPAPMEPTGGTNRLPEKMAGTAIAPAAGSTAQRRRPDPPGAGKSRLPAGTAIFWWTATTSFSPGRS